VFPEELSAERGGVPGGLVGLSVHDGVDERGVFDHDGDLGIVVPELAAVVQVCGAADHDPVICYEELGVDVEFFIKLAEWEEGRGVRLPSLTNAFISSSSVPDQGISSMETPPSM